MERWLDEPAHFFAETGTALTLREKRVCTPVTLIHVNGLCEVYPRLALIRCELLSFAVNLLWMAMLHYK